MALKYSTIDIPLFEGIDAKGHPHLVDSPKVSALTNLRFNRSRGLEMRPGYEAHGAATITSFPVERAADLDGVAIAFTGAGAFILADDDAGNARWKAASPQGPRAVEFESRSVLRADDGCTVVYCAAGGGYIAYVWTRVQTGIVTLLVTDADTGAPVYLSLIHI